PLRQNACRSGNALSGSTSCNYSKYSRTRRLDPRGRYLSARVVTSARIPVGPQHPEAEDRKGNDDVAPLLTFVLGYVAVLAVPGPNMLALSGLATLRGFRAA